MEFKYLICVFLFCKTILALYQENCGEIKGYYSNYHLRGATPAQYMEFPWIVTIEAPWPRKILPICAGAIITSRYVVTAVHCFYKKNRNGQGNRKMTRYELDQITIVPGVGNWKLRERYRTEHRIRQLISHSGYIPKDINDIGIVEVQTPINLGYNTAVRAICLPNQNDVFHGIMIVAGWGYVEKRGPDSDILLKMALPIASNEECDYRLGRRVLIDTQICTNSPTKATCFADSGGPSMCARNGKMYLCGIIASFYGNCDSVSVYTRVASFINWIDGSVQHMRKRSKQLKNKWITCPAGK